MLVLSRKVGERILVGDQIRITVVRLTNGGVRLGIEAPEGTTVVREELILKLAEQAQTSTAPLEQPASGKCRRPR
jgi:carbon storage regulator